MASESSTEPTVSITVPPELEEWLDAQAAEAGVDHEEFLLRVLYAYRNAAELDADAVTELLDEDDVAETVENQLAEQLPAQLDEQVEPIVEDALTEQITEATNSLQRRFEDRLDRVEAEFDEKMTDVRERVVQVKKETDRKAPEDHTHSELEDVEQLDTRITELEEELTALRNDFEAQPDETETDTDVDERLDQLQDRLQTVAWVVSDLREDQKPTGGLEAVERIKRAAAKADIERANCENCSESVAISLLTDPECPHCRATVTNVEPAAGWFKKPTLLTAAQLESGEHR